MLNRARAWPSSDTESPSPDVAGAFRRSFGSLDVAVYVLLSVLGLLQFLLSLRSDDFFRGDTTYFELARSLAETGVYGFDSRPETMVPPGFPAIMAAMCVLGTCHYADFVRTMPVFSTLGLIASYHLIRREEGRHVAAVICLLFGSSSILFWLSTRMVYSDLPYFLTSTLTLLLAARLEATSRRTTRMVLGPLCGFMLVSSLLIRSSGTALVAGLVGWLAATGLADRGAFPRRLKTFLPLLLVGILVQAAWLHWAATREVVEWPLGGYPRSYLSQLSIKSGNDPELGEASITDILSRITEHLADRAALLAAILTRKDYVNSDWSSPLVFGSVLLVLVGVGRSVASAGGRWPEWYFVAHEAMYLLWPWNTEERFFLPVVPLAALYLWRGATALFPLAIRKPRVVGACTFLVSVVLGGRAAAVATASGSAQLALAGVFWALLGMISARMAWSGTSDLRSVRVLGRWLLPRRLVDSQVRIPPGLRRAVGVLVVAMLVVVGVGQQVGLGLENVTFDVSQQPSYPDIEAGRWIRAQTPPTAVVMARQRDVVYHYGQRRVIWFPPLSDAELLMKGIQNHGVDYVIVVVRNKSYWLPAEQDCFESLLRTRPTAFRLVREGRRFKVFQVVSRPAA